MAEPQRIFFGSIEHSEKERLEKKDSNAMTIETLPVETLPLSEKTIESMERTKKLYADLEMQKKMREMSVPTNDELVKQRLIELQEPMVLFAEGKPERRERLRKILAERGITQTMPSTRAKSAPPADEPGALEAFLVPGPKELKDARVFLASYSLENARKRLLAQKNKVEDLEKNWDSFEKSTEQLYSKLSVFAEASSQVGDTRPLSAVSFSPNGKLLATSSWTGQCKVWDLENSLCKQTLKGHTDRAQDVLFYPQMSSTSSLCLASCGADHKVMFWNLESEKPIRVLSGHTERVNKLAFHPTGKWVASTSFDNTWGLWDCETGQELLTQGGYARAVYGIAFHCDGALVATGGLDAVGRVWDLRSGRSIWNFRGHVKQIIGLDFAPNGFQVASGSDDRTVRIWDLRKRKTSYIIPAHTHLISQVKYQPIHGNYITTCSYDGTCKIWGTKNWSLVRVFTGHEEKVTGMDIAPGPDGHVGPFEVPLRFASCSFDRTWKLWERDVLLDL